MTTGWVLNKPGYMSWWDLIPVAGFYSFGIMWGEVLGVIMEDSPSPKFHGDTCARLLDEFGFPEDIMSQVEDKTAMEQINNRLQEVVRKGKKYPPSVRVLR